jgi:hypothetical protein
LRREPRFATLFLLGSSSGLDCVAMIFLCGVEGPGGFLAPRDEVA